MSPKVAFVLECSKAQLAVDDCGVSTEDCKEKKKKKKSIIIQHFILEIILTNFLYWYNLKIVVENVTHSNINFNFSLTFDFQLGFFHSVP